MIAYRRPLGLVLVALVALAFGGLAAVQLKAELLVPSDRVARSAALVNTVQQLERVNHDQAGRVSSLREQVGSLESAAARRSDSVRRLEAQVAQSRVLAARSVLEGPGVTVDLVDGHRGADAGGQATYLVAFTDIQDVANLLFAAGAEGVAVNGRRVTPNSYFAGTPGTVAIDQGLPLRSPFRVAAVGNRAQMEQALGDPAALGDLRNRQRRFGLTVSYAGSPSINLPPSDAAVTSTYAKPA